MTGFRRIARQSIVPLLAVVALCSGLRVVRAAQEEGAPTPPPPLTPRLSLPRPPRLIDITGYWVAIVDEDWRWRMMTPPKGDYSSIPLNAEGRKVALTWDLAADEKSGNACRAYGAAGIMRIPTRLHITWADDSTLKIETDAGMQTRLLHFGASKAARRRGPVAGRFRSLLGKAASVPRLRLQVRRPDTRQGRRLEGGNHAYAPRVSTQERHPLQRKRRNDGILRHLQPGRRRLSDPHRRSRRPAIPNRPLHNQRAIRARTRRLQMAPLAMQNRTPHPLAAVDLL